MPRKTPETHLIKGRFNGTVVVLEEPAPVPYAVEVTITFPKLGERAAPRTPRTFHWVPVTDASHVVESATDELIRQRRLA